MARAWFVAAAVALVALATPAIWSGTATAVGLLVFFELLERDEPAAPKGRRVR